MRWCVAPARRRPAGCQAESVRLLSSGVVPDDKTAYAPGMPLAAPDPEWIPNRSEDGPADVVPTAGPDPLFSLIVDGERTRRPDPVHLHPCDCVAWGSEADEIRRLMKQARATLARSGNGKK